MNVLQGFGCGCAIHLQSPNVTRAVTVCERHKDDQIIACALATLGAAVRRACADGGESAQIRAVEGPPD